MEKTQWRKWSIGDISSVCNVDLFCFRRLKLQVFDKSEELTNSDHHLTSFVSSAFIFVKIANFFYKCILFLIVLNSKEFTYVVCV